MVPSRGGHGFLCAVQLFPFQRISESALEVPAHPAEVVSKNLCLVRCGCSEASGTQPLPLWVGAACRGLGCPCKAVRPGDTRDAWFIINHDTWGPTPTPAFLTPPQLQCPGAHTANCTAGSKNKLPSWLQPALSLPVPACPCHCRNLPVLALWWPLPDTGPELSIHPPARNPISLQQKWGSELVAEPSQSRVQGPGSVRSEASQ